MEELSHEERLSLSSEEEQEKCKAQFDPLEKSKCMVNANACSVFVVDAENSYE